MRTKPANPYYHSVSYLLQPKKKIRVFGRRPGEPLDGLRSSFSFFFFWTMTNQSELKPGGTRSLKDKYDRKSDKEV